MCKPNDSATLFINNVPKLDFISPLVGNGKEFIPTIIVSLAAGDEVYVAYTGSVSSQVTLVRLGNPVPQYGGFYGFAKADPPEVTLPTSFAARDINNQQSLFERFTGWCLLGGRDVNHQYRRDK